MNAKATVMQSVKDFDPNKCHHCVFHWPQFQQFTEEAFVTSLKKAISLDDSSYYHESYPNWRELNEEYTKILAILEARPREGLPEFVAACDALLQLQATQQSYIRHDLYLDLQGHPVEFVSCCR